MGKIRVDLDQLQAASGKVRNYVQSAERCMGDSQKKVNDLRGSESYKGTDATEFYRRFQSLSQSGSAFSRMNRELRNYADYLDAARSSYGNARNEAVARARRIMG